MELKKLFAKKETVNITTETFIIAMILWSLKILPAKSEVIIPPTARRDIVELTARRETPKSSLIGLINRLELLEIIPIVAAKRMLQAITIIHP